MKPATPEFFQELSGTSRALCQAQAPGSSRPIVLSPRRSPVVGRIKQTLPRPSTRSQEPRRLPRGTTFREWGPWRLHALPRRASTGPPALIGQNGGRSLSSGDPGRACALLCALWVLPACPEWPLLCYREVVERELGRGGHRSTLAGQQLPQGRVCFHRTIFN